MRKELASLPRQRHWFIVDAVALAVGIWTGSIVVLLVTWSVLLVLLAVSAAWRSARR